MFHVGGGSSQPGWGEHSGDDIASFPEDQCQISHVPVHVYPSDVCLLSGPLLQMPGKLCLSCARMSTPPVAIRRLCPFLVLLFDAKATSWGNSGLNEPSFVLESQRMQLPGSKNWSLQTVCHPLRKSALYVISYRWPESSGCAATNPSKRKRHTVFISHIFLHIPRAL